MDPIDFSRATWESLQDRIKGLRLCVLDAWKQHGPGTTQEIADRSNISILTLRPRSTELYQMGFLILDTAASKGRGQGVYRVATMDEARRSYDARRLAATDPQLNLPLE